MSYGGNPSLSAEDADTQMAGLNLQDEVSTAPRPSTHFRDQIRLSDPMLHSNPQTNRFAHEANIKLCSHSQIEGASFANTAPQISPPPNSQISQPPTSPSRSAQISNNAPGFRYKYPTAKPTPPGVDDTEWNKLYTAADSRFYNKHGKDANESKKYRNSGETYQLALKMLEEKREKAAKAASGPASKKPKTSVKKTSEIVPSVCILPCVSGFQILAERWNV